MVTFSGRLLVWRWDLGSRSRDAGTSLCALQRSCVLCALVSHPSSGCAGPQRSRVHREVHQKETLLSPGFGASVLHAD